jgi:glycosyltransferase involved in cell wall biosynthesis
VVAYQQGSVLRQLGHDVRVFAGRLGPPRERYRVHSEERDFHITWMSIVPEDLGGHTQRLLNLDARRVMARVLDEFRPDVVHFHNITGFSIAVIAACRERAIPTVMTLHDYWAICFKNLMIKNDGRLCTRGGFACLECREVLEGDPVLPSPVRNSHILSALGDVDCFISPSRYLADRFVANGLPADRVRVIRNGIDLGRYRASGRRDAAADFTIGYIGQLIGHKGIAILLEALTFMSDNTRLTIVGDGEQAAYLKDLSHRLDVQGRVEFMGKVDNRHIATIHERLDVVVVPSIWPENSPVVITEAMASGIPVVASDIGGIPELVEDGVTGFLVPPRDARALAERVEYLRRRPDERRRMSAQAVERIQSHALRSQVDRIVEVYEGLVNGGREKRDHGADVPDMVLYHDTNERDFLVQDAIDQIASLERERSEPLLLCRVDLVAPEVIGRAKMLMIPAANEDSLRYACEALRRGVPLVVHEAERELKELCLASNAGLFYAGRELKACIDLLLTDRALSAAMSVNGRAFIAANLA